MRAVVLVGGEGTRLRPLTYTTPKPLLPIANQAFLERQLTWLAQAGVTEVVLSLGYLPDAFQAHFPDGRFAGIALRYAVEDEPLGTAGAIRYAADGIDERFIVCNGDVLTGLDLRAMVAFHDAAGAEATISLSRVDDPTAFGVVPTKDDGEVIAFVEKPPPGKAPSNWINAGTYVLEPGFLERIPPRLEVSVERETFPRLLAQPGNLYGYRSDAYWIDIGTPEKYVEAHADLLSGSLGLPPVPGATEARKGIWTEGAPVFDVGGVGLVPPVLLGVGARVEAGVSLGPVVVLGAGAVVESGARVERSVLLPGACVRGGCAVRDSIVGPEADVLSDAVLADYTLVGAGATIATGMRISGGRVPQAAGAQAE